MEMLALHKTVKVKTGEGAFKVIFWNYLKRII